MNVSEAVASRKTIRAFKPDPVPRAVVEEILTKALRAPSGGNLQPWRVYMLMGEAREKFLGLVEEARQVSPMGEKGEYNVYPPDITEPYRTRRFAVGEQLYATIKIAREDKPGRIRQFQKNYQFFGAPVGLFFTMDRQMQQGQWADLGMFMQTIMLLAREYGLHTCAQEAWSGWSRIIREFFSVPQNEMIFCGLALGYADDGAPINTMVSERAPLSDFLTVREK
jgi:nitroreductase